MSQDADIDRLIQAYDSRFGLNDRTGHSALANALLGGRANRASAARPALELAAGGSADAPGEAVQLFEACGRSLDMARAALEYQIRINEVILGIPAT